MSGQPNEVKEYKKFTFLQKHEIMYLQVLQITRQFLTVYNLKNCCIKIFFNCWFIMYCCDRKARAACAQSFTQEATLEVTRGDHYIIACSHHIYMGVVLCALPVRGESHIQHNTSGEFATTSPPFYN